MPGRIPAAFCLLTALLGLSLPPQAADTQTLYPVGAVSASGYLFEDGAGAVDLGTAVTGPGAEDCPIPYGESVYYPLLNSSVSGLLYERASDTFEVARAALEESQQALTEAAQLLDEAEQAARSACGETDSDAFLFSDEGYLAALDRYNAVKSDYDEARAAFRRTQGEDPIFDSENTDPYVREDEAVSRIRISAEWEEGSEYVDSLSVVKKTPRSSKHTEDLPIYFLAVTMKERENDFPASAPVTGTVSLRQEEADGFPQEGIAVTVSLQIGLDKQEPAALIPVSPAPFQPNGGPETLFGFEADKDSFYLAAADAEGATLGLDCRDDPSITAAYPDADLRFCNGNGGDFQQPGYLFLSAGQRRWLYSIQPDGSLRPLYCSYDAEQDLFLIRTRVLGRYLLSDAPLPADRESAVVAVVCDNATGVNYRPASAEYAAGDGGWSPVRPAALDDSTSIRAALADNGLTIETALQDGDPAPVPEQDRAFPLGTVLLATAAAAAACFLLRPRSH